MNRITCRKLANSEFPLALALRIAVFVDEQNVPLEEEQDKYDEHAVHFGAWDGDHLIGTGRLVVIEQKGKIGRIAVSKEFRNRGVGRLIVETILDECRRENLTEAFLSSQVRVMGFYGLLGFIPEGEEYDDGGIPHKTMRLLLDSRGRNY